MTTEATKTTAGSSPVERPVMPIVDRLRERALELDADAEAAFSDSGIDAGFLKEAATEIERLQMLTFCGCGDQFTAHDPGTCGACVAGMTCAPGRTLGA